MMMMDGWRMICRRVIRPHTQTDHIHYKCVKKIKINIFYVHMEACQPVQLAIIVITYNHL